MSHQFLSSEIVGKVSSIAESKIENTKKRKLVLEATSGVSEDIAWRKWVSQMYSKKLALVLEDLEHFEKSSAYKSMENKCVISGRGRDLIQKIKFMSQTSTNIEQVIAPILKNSEHNINQWKKRKGYNTKKKIHGTNPGSAPGQKYLTPFPI